MTDKNWHDADEDDFLLRMIQIIEDYPVIRTFQVDAFRSLAEFYWASAAFVDMAFDAQVHSAQERFEAQEKMRVELERYRADAKRATATRAMRTKKA